MRFGNDSRGGALLLTVMAAVALFVASRTAAGVLGASGRRPGLRALGHWVPIAVTCAVALLLKQPEVAVALAFSTSVAALSFVLGVLTYAAPMDPPPASRRAWPFVLPAALLALVAGFSGQFTWVHALAMLVLGGAVYSAWREAAAAAGEPDIVYQEPLPVRPAWLDVAEVALSVVLALVGGWAAVTLAARAAATIPLVSTRLVAVAVLTPLLCLPMLAAAPPERAPSHTSSMASTLVALALLNLCCLVPLLTIAWLVGGGIVAAAAATHGTYASNLIVAAGAHAPAMPFPLATWRIDAVVLAVLGFAMVPVSLGRWQLGRWESIGLVAGYALYLAVSAAVSLRT
jgi:Ca2+/Na+ antiporter